VNPFLVVHPRVAPCTTVERHWSKELVHSQAEHFQTPVNKLTLLSFVSFIFMPAFPLGRVAEARYTSFRSELFSSRDFSVLVVPVSRHFGQAMKSCRNLICSLFNANVLKSKKGFISKKNLNVLQDLTVNQHECMIFVIISKQIKS